MTDVCAFLSEELGVLSSRPLAFVNDGCMNVRQQKRVGVVRYCGSTPNIRLFTFLVRRDVYMNLYVGIFLYSIFPKITELCILKAQQIQNIKE